MAGVIYNGGFSLNSFVENLQNSSPVRDVIAVDINNTGISTGSFRLNQPGTGFKSTQQLPIDWSKFENHTFFNSAQAKTNVAFERVFNAFPFDGTKVEIEDFLDTLTGFEKYIYDSFPKSVGYLNFDGTNYISVNDKAGIEVPVMSRDTSGASKIDPGLKSITFEMQLFIPEISNDNQVILQKINGTDEGITLAVSSSASTSNCDLVFAISSGQSWMSASYPLEKGKFKSVSAQFNRSPGVDRLFLYVDSELVTSSSNSTYIGQINFKSSPLTLGSGSAHVISGTSFLPTSNLSASIDDLRIYHSLRTPTMISSSMLKTVYADENLKMLFRFNEPTGSYTSNARVIDHSGNGLHANITNYNQTQRVKHVDSPLTLEKDIFSPVLFPDHPDITSLNSDLLEQALVYDRNNPNLITKLIPQHYLTREQEFYVLPSSEGGVGNSISDGNVNPGGVKLGSIQLISSLLYVWAKQFDETKCYIDHMSKLKSAGYDDLGNIADQMLPSLASYYGLDLPNLFKSVNANRFILGESTNENVIDDSVTMQRVQNVIWRRILQELPVIMKSKGTTHAIKSLIRAAGIEPNSLLKFKEYGGTRDGYILPNRSQRSVIASDINFSGSLFDGAVNYDVTTGIPDTLPFLISPYLSASRIEPGLPIASGLQNDGLFTSGSWSYESFYKFEKNVTHPSVQSLVRFHLTGTSTPSNNHAIIMNLIASKGSTTSSLELHMSAKTSSDSYASVRIPDVDIFDGSRWYISFGRLKSEQDVSSSYYLWASRQDNMTNDYFSASSYFDDKNSAIDTKSSYNTSGSFFCIGPQSLYVGGTKFLNSTNAPIDSQESIFTGKVSGIKFWTKCLTQNELIEHSKNVESVGVENPLLNYNFTSHLSGSWERLRIDATANQSVTSSNGSGNLNIFDYSQNNFHISGSGFGPNQSVIQPERINSSVISMQFDEAVTDNKIRIRGMQDYDSAIFENAEISPVYEVRKSETPLDDLRFSIEISASRILDEDIAKIFATLDEMDNAIGQPELQFSPDYPRLEVIRDIYFNRLTEKIKIKQLYEFFKWFDTSMTTLIEKFIPSNTRFLGVNYIVEPHSLERAKFNYQQSGIYLGENERRGLKGTVTLGQVSTRVRRF